MDATAFEAELKRDGFEVVHGEAEKGPDAPMHVHDFDLRFLVIDGAFTLVLENERRLHNPGDVCVVPRNVMHNEILATQHLRFVAGQRPVRIAADGAAFDAELQRDGYKIVKGGFNPAPDAAFHRHDFDVRFMVLEGALTITREFDRHTYKAGDTCYVPAGTLHQESTEGRAVRYIAGTRPAAA
jgi:quercetin dioxygenase-like cupin family protein